MFEYRPSFNVLLALLALALPLMTFVSHADEDALVLDKYQFAPSGNVRADVEQAILDAKQRDRLAIIVFGAQWCHDSRGLAAKFSTSEMQDVLNMHYETVFVDVGYLQDRRRVTELFGYPNYFATPTVLVIDPSSLEILNLSGIKKWQAADSVDLEDYVSDFTALATQTREPQNLFPDSPAGMQLKLFSDRMSSRLTAGYAKLGPQLQAWKEDTLEDEEAFDQLWEEVRAFRTQLQQDLHSLADSARQKAEQKDTSLLELPQYPSQSWEQE